MKCIVAFALALALAPAPVLLAARQEGGPAQGDQMRLEGVEVMVDAVVLDKKKRPVSGLTVGDFQVLEDGKEQQVSGFRAVSSETPGLAAAETTRDASTTRFPTHRTVVVTDGTVQDVHMDDVVKALDTYFRETMTRDDYVTLFAIGGNGMRLLYPTSNDKGALIQALTRVGTGGYGTLLEAERAFIEAGRSQNSADMATTPTPEAQSSGQPAGGGMSSGSMVDPRIVEAGLLFSRNAFAQAAELQTLRQSWSIYDALAALIHSHRTLPGRRSITIFSEGFGQSKQVQSLKDSVVSAATSAGVSLYIVDARGIAPENERGASSRAEVDRAQGLARMRGSDRNSERTSSLGGGTIFDSVPRDTTSRTDILSELAASTGGLFMKNSNDLAAGLFDIDRDLRNYYLIFYQPREPRLRGEYRRIEVRVRNHPDVAVRAREGYFAVPEEARGLFRLEDQRLLIRAAAVDPGKTLRFAVRAYAFGGANGATRVSYALEVPPDAIALTEKKEGKVKQFGVDYQGLIIVRDANGRLLATQHLPWSLVFDENQAKTLRAEGIRYEGGMDVPGTDVGQVEVVLADNSRDKTGKLTMEVKASDWSGGPALSDIVLGRAVIRARGETDEATFKQGNMYLLPVATPIFGKDDTLNVLAAAYWPEGKKLQSPVLSVWQGKERLAFLTLEMAPGGGGADGWIFTGIPVKDIPPGEYSVRVTIRDEQGRAANRETKFTVK
jgi:VWFA-related protein